MMRLGPTFSPEPAVTDRDYRAEAEYFLCSVTAHVRADDKREWCMLSALQHRPRGGRLQVVSACYRIPVHTRSVALLRLLLGNDTAGASLYLLSRRFQTYSIILGHGAK